MPPPRKKSWTFLITVSTDCVKVESSCSYCRNDLDCGCIRERGATSARYNTGTGDSALMRVPVGRSLLTHRSEPGVARPEVKGNFCNGPSVGIGISRGSDVPRDNGAATHSPVASDTSSTCSRRLACTRTRRFTRAYIDTHAHTRGTRVDPADRCRLIEKGQREPPRKAVNRCPVVRDDWAFEKLPGWIERGKACIPAGAR